MLSVVLRRYTILGLSIAAITDVGHESTVLDALFEEFLRNVHF
jgi:hypothetical protein